MSQQTRLGWIQGGLKEGLTNEVETSIEGPNNLVPELSTSKGRNLIVLRRKYINFKCFKLHSRSMISTG